ncbi:MAG TPA: bifunctional [glutamine synthetase] adenylyltransferase/[glutamine synthetase]-adenylyl-L-tyrosine phosphorylase [Nocardioides sp.]|uniref:bifunctional [glutamine synthetase] adenylyltransferase/[glutamine synthetase]-adenylyl-L-tyrosine phosphorylase n=1 Tax=Nocardioides sp. TaxID=35761 RepID=UPI002E2EEE36|nr:bifunctional [glutamine synthetase] adenylyltransferase/[glutamine synthetase]-adenylyl-L-tyrosine phosphorylase [Nocardioides sp.]HEX5088246.1 bifunctional [glutamine synthetase] adenylyltransferase/[glutamine synthetase]-adenylyl-L-tyrosine phosphorylase [Nocardioides sp.]
MSHPTTEKGRLLRLGFEEPQLAESALSTLGEDVAEPLVALIARTPDPDLSLATLVRLAEAAGRQLGPPERDRLLAALVDDEGTAMRLLSVLGASEALGDHLCRHPEHWRELTDPTLGSTRPPAYAVREALLQAVAGKPDHEAVDALRVEYRRLLLRLAARDLTHHLGVDDVAGELSDLAAGVLDAALEIARQRVGESAALARLAVVAMGKCGGHELNYVSDVDVVFVHEPGPGDGHRGADETAALKAATQLAGHLMRICSEHTGEGTIWQVDAALRPEGKAGPLTRTLASHRGYYEKWASTWEFQALLKARAVAGDLDLGRQYVEMVQPFVWSAAGRDGFVEDTQAMRRRVVEHIPTQHAERQLKLGSGGLRDVEFAVQLLQLVHGRADDRIRQPTTLAALDALTRHGYVGRDDGESLHRAYSFLRTLEHRIQLFRLRRTHVVPSDERSLRRLGRSMGHFKEPVASLDHEWQHHRREVRRLHEKLFYRPLLTAVARLDTDEARLTPAAATQRLAALGFADPAAALRHLEALTSGVTRRANIQRQLLPAMLDWFAEAPDPDAGLFGFRKLSEALGRTPWYLKTLRDEGQVAERLARLLATSRYVSDLLEKEPAGVRMLGEELTPLTAQQYNQTVVEEMLAAAGRRDDAEQAVRAIRAVRRRELFRVAAGDTLGLVDVADVGAALSRITDATLEATLQLVQRTVAEAKGLSEPPARMAVVAMGRYGGFELSYGSDADVLFVHEPVTGADGSEADGHEASSYAVAVANELRRLLALPGGDPPLEVDAALRPEGKQGPLSRSLESHAAYYAKWSKVWEAQALLRADAVVGDPDLRRRFTELIDPLRYPPEGLSDDEVVEVHRIKARVDEERLPRGADPASHLKLGRGGLADIEWTVQLLQMQHASVVPGLRTSRTLEALAAAREASLLSEEDADTLIRGWRWVSRVRNAIALVRGRGGDQLPHDVRDRAAVANVLGYPPGSSDQMVNDHLRTMRVSHAVVDRVFWG